jgi:TonB family protein
MKSDFLFSLSLPRALVLAALGHAVILFCCANRFTGISRPGPGDSGDAIAVSDGSGYGDTLSDKRTAASKVRSEGTAKSEIRPLRDRSRVGGTAPSVAAPGLGLGTSGGGAGLAPTGHSGGESSSVRAKYFALLREAIARQRVYPPRSRDRGETGQVGVAFSVLPDGTIEGVRVEKASAFPSLDRAALDSVQRVGQVAPLPLELGQSPLHVVIDVEYALE